MCSCQHVRQALLRWKCISLHPETPLNGYALFFFFLCRHVTSHVQYIRCINFAYLSGNVNVHVSLKIMIIKRRWAIYVDISLRLLLEIGGIRLCIFASTFLQDGSVYLIFLWNRTVFSETHNTLHSVQLQLYVPPQNACFIYILVKKVCTCNKYVMSLWKGIFPDIDTRSIEPMGHGWQTDGLQHRSPSYFY